MHILKLNYFAITYKVSEAYTLHRQTFYLAQDYFDRFMLTQNNMDKGMLQLIGITCLFLASKMEVRMRRTEKSPVLLALKHTETSQKLFLLGYL